jgi:hypothetical protein
MLKYRKIYDLITKTWVLEPYDTDPSREESNIPGEAKLKAIGHYKGMKGKSFSDMTPEEQKLFTDTEEEIENED